MVLDFCCSLCSLSCNLSRILLVKLFWSCKYCIQVAQGLVHPHHITCTSTGVLWRTWCWGTFMLQTPKSRRFSGSSARYWASLQKSCTRCVWYVHVCMLACLIEYNMGVSGWGGCPDIASFFTQMISATMRPSLAGVSGHTHTYSNIPVSLRRREEGPAGFLGGGTEPLLPLHNLAQRR